MARPILQSFRLRVVLVVFILFCFGFVEARGRKNKTKGEEVADSLEENIPQVPYLIETIGKEIYSAVNRPKYKFYIYMTVGKLPSEESTIVLLNLLCNLLYGTLVFFGFLFLPRGWMLLVTLMTLLVGPALVLILLGATAAALAAFALYPLYSVAAIWVFFFLTSQVAQVLGKNLGLDHDHDGDVDWLDLLHYASHTKVGKYLGLIRLHSFLNRSSMNPFLEINRRLDAIQHQTQAMSSRSFENQALPGNSNHGDYDSHQHRD